MTLVYSLCLQNQKISFVYLSRKSSCHTCNLILCTCQCKSRGGGGVRARGGDLMPETIPPVGLLIVRSDPRVGTFNFDRQKPSTNSEVVTKSVGSGRDPFNQNSDWSDREKRTTSKGGPVFSKLFRLDRTDPLSFGPKFPEILVEWIAPSISAVSRVWSLVWAHFPEQRLVIEPTKSVPVSLEAF